ncbi:MAG: ATP-binding protein, partial [Ginsengibacter sp.]
MGTPYIQPATSILADAQEDENPFVGLRPYEAEESYLFFGRGKQITELLQKLYVTRFIGVVGSSGCGKSSLIKAGLIPKLKAGFLTNERDHWLTATMRPAGNPLLFLAEAVCAELHASQFVPDDFLPHGNYSAALSKSIHEKGVQGVSDFLLPIFEKTSCNLLLVVDQFEELFTTKRENADAETQMNENVLFVNMLLSLSRQKDLPVYVVITMRSDYIGNCNKFYGLPETLNEGQYLVPRLNRQQLNEVIELPIKMNGEKISAR